MELAHTILLDRWKTAGERVPKAPDGAAKASELEKKYDVSLPNDFRLYVTDCAPAEDIWDETDLTWWMPSRIKNIPDEYEHAITNPQIADRAHTYLFFADYCVWFWAWAICCDDGPDRGKVALVTGRDDRVIAASFTEFVKAYVADPMSVSPS